MADLDTFGATVTRTVGRPGRRRVETYALIRDRAGSFLMAGMGTAPSVAYDAPTDTLTRSGVRDGGGSIVEASPETGLAAGPPDASGYDGALPDAEVGYALRTFAELEDVAAVARRASGTDVWVLEADLGDRGGDDVDRVTLLLDQAHLAPVRVTFAAGGEVVRTVTFREVVLDGLAPGTFSVDPGGRGRAVDRGFRTVGLAAVDAAVGRGPLRPAFLPPGYELAAVTVRTEGAAVALRYQRGFERIVVTTRSSPVAGGVRWADPFDRGGAVVSIEEAALE
ncbi:MAG: hypothetical protein WKF43_07520 [Acidimicrobiales bacterium]